MNISLRWIRGPWTTEAHRSNVSIERTSTHLRLPYAPRGAYGRAPDPTLEGGCMSRIRRTTPQPEPFLRYPGSALVVALLADKWTIPVIHALARGTKRTGELRRALAGVSQKMLTQTLRALERQGLIERRVYPVVPPRVEYRLTPMGESINRPLRQLCDWTLENGAALERAMAGRQRKTRNSETEPGSA